MATYIKPDLDFSTFPVSDGAPMAETRDHMDQMYGLIFAAHNWLEMRGLHDHATGGNQFLYYNQRNGNDHCSPDVYIALGVPPGNRAKWETWVEGKCPDIVMEITSPSTAREDRQEKVALYERLGAQEYYIYDPKQETTPVFAAYWRRGGRLEWESIPASGGIVSPLLGAELRPVGQFLRIINPATGEPLLVPDELWPAMWAVEARAREEEQARRTAEARAREEQQARQAAEERATEARRAVLAAEERIAWLEAALHAAATTSSTGDSENDPSRP